jgi:hypothetical protein
LEASRIPIRSEDVLTKLNITTDLFFQFEL